MELRLLGTTELVIEGDKKSLGGPMARAVLADLALNAGQTLVTSQLIDDLWGLSPPASAVHTVQAYLSRLRRILNRAAPNPVLVTRGPGYMLDVNPSQVDVLRFSALVGEGRVALVRGDARTAETCLSSGLSLWRGLALADVQDASFAPIAAARLEEERLVALETLFDARLQLGHDRELVAALQAAIAANPLREHLHAQLMTALYRSGRQADSLAAYQHARDRLVNELGVEPGRELRQLERAVLAQAPELELTPNSSRDRPVSPPLPEGIDLARPRGASTWARPSTRLPRRGTAFRLVGVSVVVVLIAAGVLAKLASPAGGHPVALGVNELSAASGRTVESLSLTSEPGSAASGDGSVWVTSPVDGTLYRIDPTSAAIEATVPIGNGAGAVVVSGSNVWVANTITGVLSQVSAETDEVVRTLAVGPEPTGIAVGDGSLWVANASASTLTEVDAESGAITTYPLASPPFGVAYGAGSVWLSNPADGTVTRISPQGGTAVQIPAGAGPTAVVFGLGSVWVTNGIDNTVSRINPMTDAITATLPVGSAPDALALAGGTLWVANRLSSTLVRIDARTDTVSRPVTTAGGPMALSALGRSIWTATGGSVAARSSGGTLKVLSSVPTPSIDPALNYPSGPFQIFEGTYDTLVTFQQVGGSGGLQLVPDLALAMPTVTDGGTSYSFVLRPGLRYSDGRRVFATDFRRAIERVMELNENASVWLSEIVGAGSCQLGHPCDLSAGIITSDRAGTITFHLSAPDPYFLYQLAFQFTAPEPPGEPDHDVGTHPVASTGPYMIGRYVPGHELVFVRNPYFHEWSAAAEPPGSPDRIVWTFGEPVPREIAEIKAGDADWTDDTIPDVGQLAAQFPAQVHSDPALSIDYVAFNVRVPPFNNSRVRQAFSLAANRAQLVAMLGGPDAATPACQILPPGIPGFERYCPFTVDPTASGAWVGPNISAARNLVAKSGTRGMRVVFWSQLGMGTTSVFAVSVLRELGYKVSMVTPSLSTFFANVNNSARNVQVSDATWYADYPSASDFFDLSFRCSAWKLDDPSVVRNGSFFCDPGLDRLMNLADEEEQTDPAQAGATWAEVDRGVTDAAPWVVLANLPDVDFLSSRVANYQYDPAFGVLLDQLQIRQR